MTCRIRLVLAIHDHQPVGNFDGVFEDAYRDSYRPFLETLEAFPEIPISLHTSGSLLEWLVRARPEYIERVRRLVERGQIEILGGPFYEPILACIPRRDRVGQIAAYSRYLEQVFGTPIRGMWVPERVWEQSFASDIVRAGIEYTLLDDHHFKSSGLSEDQLAGYYLSEDESRLLKIFPGSERLRYTIPFRPPQETIDYLGAIAEKGGRPVVVFGDDGEKFGTWPDTKKHVYEDGWLRQFFETLRHHRDWLKVTTLAEAVDSVPPIGTCYLADCSYREMTEWALPAEKQIEWESVAHQYKETEGWPRLRPFLRGGFWRNFRVKYREVNEMYARMLEVSHKLDEVAQSAVGRANSDALRRARNDLYRGQCNCPYWHGAFGGLYLPHLRNAIYRHLIAADNQLEQLQNRTERWVEVTSGDFNLDTFDEVRLAGDRLIAYLAPHQGGHLYELDIRLLKHNLLATLDRRFEPYHQKVLDAGQQYAEGHSADDPSESVASIHEMVRFKQPDLDKKIVYDNWPRKSLVDHFLQPGLSIEEFQKGVGELGDFVTGGFTAVTRQSPSDVVAVLSRTGTVGPYHPTVTKTITLDSQRGSILEIAYEIENLPGGIPFHFGVEFNFAGMAAGASDRYYYDALGSQLGPLETVNQLKESARIGLIDEWLGLDVALEMSQPGTLWTFPIETISQSEGGFEQVHQSSCVMPHWEFVAPDDGRWSVRLTLSLDTSAAQARELGEVSEPQSIGIGR